MNTAAVKAALLQITDDVHAKFDVTFAIHSFTQTNPDAEVICLQVWYGNASVRGQTFTDLLTSSGYDKAVGLASYEDDTIKKLISEMQTSEFWEPIKKKILMFAQIQWEETHRKLVQQANHILGEKARLSFKQDLVNVTVSAELELSPYYATRIRSLNPESIGMLLPFLDPIFKKMDEFRSYGLTQEQAIALISQALQIH